MQRKHRLLRMTAVLSSLSLMAAFVAYRAGALDSLVPGRSGREVLSGTKSRTLVSPNGRAATLPGSKSQIHIVTPHNATATLPGSKSDILVGTSTTSELTIPSDMPEVLAHPSSVLMYSSKSGVMIDTPALMTNESNPNLPSSTTLEPVLMSGSKSITIVPPSGSPGKTQTQP